MKLKKIELQGFKSFADKTEIIFLDGITTIVGPNGSGKSNISDALKWVLGEQSVKTLRGAKMEDVIFAGTQVRKKVGFAEVSMYIDNSDAELPVDFNEVVITRRVYRTGESNYLINNSECRLKDIQELFMDTGVGRDGYSIISQGKVDEILSSKSDERRKIFEEASGIVKYRTRKDEATKKLNNTEESLTRVNDVLVEIESVLEPLEKKAEVAKKYLVLKDDLKKYDVKLFLNLVNENSDNLKKLDELIDTFDSDIKKEEEAYSSMESEKAMLKERLQEIALKIEENQEKYFNINNETEKLNSKVDLTTSQIENDKNNIIRLEAEIVEDTEKIELLKQEIEKRLEKRKSMSENKVKFENELAEKQEELNAILLTLDQKGIEIEKVKQEIEVANDEKYELRENISSFEATIEANDKQIEEKKKQAERTISQKDSINASKDDVYMELNSKTKELNAINDEIETLNNSKKKLVEEQYEHGKNEGELKQELMTLKSKYNYLINLDNENEGYHKSVKEAIEYSSNNKNVYGTLASLISTDEKYEYAIEIALGTYIQNIVVESELEAKDIINYLKQNSIGRATFLPLNNLKTVKFDMESKAAKCNGYIGVASKLVKFDKKYEKAIELSLGTTVIVDTIDNAISMSKTLKNSVRIVTLSGEMIAATGSITGGQTAKAKSGIIGRKDKIEKLKITIDEKEKVYNEIYEKTEKLKVEIDEIKEKLSSLWTKKDECNVVVATLNEKFENLRKEVEKIENAKEQTATYIETIEKENNEIKANLEKCNLRISEIDENNTSKQEIVDEYARFNKDKQQEIDFLNEDIVNLKISLSSFDESVSSIDEMKEKIEQDIKNFEFGIARKKEQIDTLNVNIENMLKEIDELKLQIEDKSTFKEEFAKISENLKSEKEGNEAKQEEFDKKMIISIQTTQKIRDEKAKIESKKVKFDIELENLKNRMWDDYELTISSAKAYVEKLVEEEELTIKEINKKAESIKKEIKGLGEVQVSAIEEYKEKKERYDFIIKQKEDLEETKTKLNNLIANMTSIMKSQFEKQFKIITENFNETFKELFGGGKAELRLDDESRILESGIEIEVQPPGKKLQSMMLLSGGERALTAIALLFAILKIKSPPFCILDEIEAALDDVNVHRFAQYIKKYSNKTQFVVITHRKGTMEVASSTYGVTMQEYGISKVVSMKMKD